MLWDQNIVSHSQLHFLKFEMRLACCDHCRVWLVKIMCLIAHNTATISYKDFIFHCFLYNTLYLSLLLLNWNKKISNEYRVISFWYVHCHMYSTGTWHWYCSLYQVSIVSFPRKHQRNEHSTWDLARFHWSLSHCQVTSLEHALYVTLKSSKPNTHSTSCFEISG